MDFYTIKAFKANTGSIFSSLLRILFSTLPAASLSSLGAFILASTKTELQYIYSFIQFPPEITVSSIQKAFKLAIILANCLKSGVWLGGSKGKCGQTVIP